MDHPTTGHHWTPLDIIKYFITFISSIKDLPTSGPVGSWLSELKNVHESECTIMLQSKPVRKSESDQMREGITDIKERIKLIQDRAHLLSGIFANMCR